MLSLGKLSTQAHYNTLLGKPISHYLQFPSKPHFPFSARLNFQSVLAKSQNGLHRDASRTQKKGELIWSEMDGPDESEDDDGFLDADDDVGEFDVDVDEDEDEIVMPLMNMKKWLENRPRGFGEGKVYDTSIEDKLMEEIEQSREAQFANVSKLKNGTVNLKPGPEKEINKQEKGPTQIQEGFTVRLLNLPRKKNIRKDLRLAFEGVRGISNIAPVVSGNEKTRDPVCKGLALIDFKHQDDAQRFVQNFSGKSITFGKVQKQIKCEMTSLKKRNPARDQSDDEVNRTREQVVLNCDVRKDADVQIDVSSPLDSLEGSFSTDDDEINGTLINSDSDLAEELEVEEWLEMNSTSSKQARKLNSNEKKVVTKRRKHKIAKLNIRGSANRLKIREKEMLVGVFSKYGATLKERSSR